MVSFAPEKTPAGTITNLLSGASRPISGLTIEGTRVRVEQSDPRPPVLIGTLEGNRITGTAEARGGRTGTFRLIRIARGTGGSTGEWRGTTFEELADDVVAGARFLQSRADVDERRIGFWGLSQGAWSIPRHVSPGIYSSSGTIWKGVRPLRR